jgi:hypothetical protein
MKLIMQKYSSAYTSDHLYRNEVKIVTSLQLKGLSKEEIRQKVTDENLFHCRSESAIKEMFPRVYKRTLEFDNYLRETLAESSRSDSNAILLYGFLKTYRFPREFVTEVLQYNRKTGKNFVTKGNIAAFFEQKAEQDEIVRNWSEETTNNVRRKTLMILSEGELLKKSEEGFSIQSVPLSSRLYDYIKKHEEYQDMITLTLNN